MMEQNFKILIFGIVLCSFVSDTVQLSRELFTNEPCGSDLFRCDNSRCTDLKFRCDGDSSDCQDGSDERDCRLQVTEVFGYHMIRQTREKAAEWLIRQTENASATDDWDYTIARAAVALYLTNETYFVPGNSTGQTIARKLRLQMLDKLAQRNIEDIPTTELAVFLNAFLVSCVNPRNFHGVDLVVELRVRTNSPAEYTNPYALLALCNAGENMTDGDIRKLRDVFQNAKRELWSDMRAYAMMALSCAAVQPHNSINMTSMADQFNDFLPPQDANGTVDNIKTTALIVQGFIAASKFPSPPSRSWHRKKWFNANLAFSELFRGLKSNDSIDKVLLMYYVLPVLSYKNIANISFSHCRHHVNEEIDAPLEEKRHVIYSLWFGMDKYVEKTLRIRVPSNAKFQSAMDIASKLDYSYKYNSTLIEGHRYVYSISGTQDDPENDKFWFFYRVTDNLATEIINQNPFEYIPTNNEHLLFWFRKGPWSIEE